MILMLMFLMYEPFRFHNLPLNLNEPPLAVRPHRCKRSLQHISAVVLEDPAPLIPDHLDEVFEVVNEQMPVSEIPQVLQLKLCSL